MATAFKDKHGREWRVEIEVRHLVPLKEAGCDIRSMAKAEGGLFAAYALQPWEIGETLWLLCRDQAEANGVADPTAFAEGFDAQAMDDAREALLEAVVLFSQGRKIGRQAVKGIPAMLSQVEEEAARMMDRILTNSKSSASSSPASPGSTPPA